MFIMDYAAIRELTTYPLVSFKKGDSLIDYNSGYSDVYYLVKGHCIRMTTTSAGEELFFEEYTAGQDAYALVGALANFKSRTAVADSSMLSMLALSSIKAHRLSAEEYDAFLARHPSVMRELMTRLTDEYLILLNNYVGKQRGQSGARVAAFLLERARLKDGILACAPLFTISNIARFLGMHRITVNKIVLALRTEGVIDYSPQGIRILNQTRLQDYARGIEKLNYKK